jgi:hypothetical protein
MASTAIEPAREHGKAAVGIARPFLRPSIPIKFDAVLVRIAQVQGLADAVIAGAIEENVCAPHPVQRIGKRGACWIEDRGGGIARSFPAPWRRAAPALPRVQSDVVMIPTGGNERGLVP